MAIKFGRQSKEQEEELRINEMQTVRKEIAENVLTAEAIVKNKKTQIINDAKRRLSKGLDVKITDEMVELKLVDEIVQLKTQAEFALRLHKEFIGDDGLEDIVDLDTPSSWL